MDNQMIYGIQDALRSKIRVAFCPATNLVYATANHTGEAQYELTSDWQPVMEDTVLSSGTVFIKGSVAIPENLAANEEYEDYLCVSIPEREGQVLINGEHYQ